jgi:uncharacterized membrane protein
VHREYIGLPARRKAAARAAGPRGFPLCIFELEEDPPVKPIDQDRRGGIKETGRVEAFSDGVFAIAITLLVLDLHVPRDLHSVEGILGALREQWPAYLAFLLSFATIGIMWINHHYLFNLITRTDHWLLVFNALLLLTITVVPFPTSLLAEYIGHGGQEAAMAVYSGWSLLIALMFNLVWRYATHKGRLLSPRADLQAVRAISRGYAFGPFLYLLSFGLSFVSVPASLGVAIALAVFFALPGNALRKLTGIDGRT